MFVKSEFNAAIARKGMTKTDVARVLNITPTTLFRKLRRGGDFNRAEIGVLIDKLDIDDPVAVFFAPEITET